MVGGGREGRENSFWQNISTSFGEEQILIYRYCVRLRRWVIPGSDKDLKKGVNVTLVEIKKRKILDVTKLFLLEQQRNIYIHIYIYKYKMYLFFML